MKVRADVAELLRAGKNNTEIARELHMTPRTVRKARRALHIPPVVLSGRRSRPTLEATFRTHTEPVDGGHLSWTGSRQTSGSPRLMHQGQPLSGYRVAFIIRHGRDPVGRVNNGCGYPGCIHPDHVEDRPMRQRNRDTYQAIFGKGAAS